MPGSGRGCCRAVEPWVPAEVYGKGARRAGVCGSGGLGARSGMRKGAGRRRCSRRAADTEDSVKLGVGEGAVSSRHCAQHVRVQVDLVESHGIVKPVVKIVSHRFTSIALPGPIMLDARLRAGAVVPHDPSGSFLASITLSNGRPSWASPVDRRNSPTASAAAPAQRHRGGGTSAAAPRRRHRDGGTGAAAPGRRAGSA